MFALLATGLAKDDKRDKRHLVTGFSGYSGLGTAYAAPVATIAAAPVATIAAAPVAQTVAVNHHTHTHSVERVNVPVPYTVDRTVVQTVPVDRPVPQPYPVTVIKNVPQPYTVDRPVPQVCVLFSNVSK